jgi:hypothetical protein
MKKHILAGLMLLQCFNTVHALPEAVAWLGTAASAGIPAYWVIANNEAGIKYPVGAVVGAVTGWLGYKFFHQFTPAGRLKRAAKRMEYLRSNPLAANAFETTAETMNAVQELYISREWYLIVAFNELTRLIEESKFVGELIQAARDGDSNYAQEANKLENEMNQMIRNMTNVIKIIRLDSQYIAQLEQYKREKYHKENLDVQYANVYAQQSQANAHWANAQNNRPPRR